MNANKPVAALRPLTPAERREFPGCKSEVPLAGFLPWCAVVLDGWTVRVYATGMEVQDEWSVWAGAFESRDRARAVANEILASNDPAVVMRLLDQVEG